MAINDPSGSTAFRSDVTGACPCTSIPGDRGAAPGRQLPELRNASDGPSSTAAAFELPIDAGAGPRDVDGFAAFTNKESSLMDLRKKSSAMWADQRI
jgi:hypothetical protein